MNKEYTFLDYCMEEDAPTIMEKWGMLLGGSPVTFEMRWKNNTPTGQWVQAACTPIFDDTGNIVSISGCTTDISAQKRAQEDALKRAEVLEQVRVSQARLLQFTDNAPIGIVILERSGKPLYINRSWFSITDHPETLPSEVDIMSVCYPDDVPKVKRKQDEAISQKKTVEFRARLKKQWTCVDGSFQGQAWVSIMYLPEFDEDGVLSRIMSTCTDISHSQFSEHLQRKRLEEAIEAKRRTEAFIDITR
jgi:PAS domain-containing protein